MLSRWSWFLVALLPLLALVQASSSRPRAAAPPPHRSPLEVAVLPGGRLALSANHTADSATLVDLEQGKILQELPCGRRPSAVACSRDGRRAAVSNLWSGSVTLFAIEGERLRALAEVPVGHQPRGLAFSPDGEGLHVALSGADEIASLRWADRTIVRRLPALREPRRVAITPDGQHLVVVCSRSAQVRCFEARTGELVWERGISDGFNLLGLTLSPDGKDIFTAHVHHRHHPMVRSNIEQGWALNSRLARMPLQMKKDGSYSQIALDIRNRAVGDPTSVAVSPTGEHLAVAAGGTQELLLIQSEPVNWVGGEPGDFLDSDLQRDNRLRRVALGGRPVDVRFLPGGNLAVVANYLGDSLQVVDVKAGKLTKTIGLGGPATASLERRGEAIFFDAKRSHHQWFSCNTCHTDGHTSSRSFDTLNDDSTNTTKMTPTLRGVTRTGPWTWHGWQESLPSAVEKSLTETMWGPQPTPEDVKAVVAFLGTLEHPPARVPSRSPAAERGRDLFAGKGRCARCHQGEDYTSKKNYDVKLPPDGSPFDKWNPPTLRSISDRGPYLHDGSAETLDELLRLPHAPEKLGGQPLTPEERRDLIEFLRTL